MTIEVLIFGASAMQIGRDRVTVTVPQAAVETTEGTTAAIVLNALDEQHPDLNVVAIAARLAVNQAFAKPDTPVRPSDEVALIALVSGG